MRRFMMVRHEDATGVSGVGHVADGVVFDDGATVVRWRTATTSTAVYASLDAARAIHGHDGKTSFVFHDDTPPVVWLCCMCLSDMDLPVNHCFQCGAGGSAVPMSKAQLVQLQLHDKQRVEAIERLRTEAFALRRVAIDTYGPTALGLSVRRYTDHDGVERVAGIQRGNTTFCGAPVHGETVQAYLERAGERADLDPDHVRRVHAARAR